MRLQFDENKKPEWVQDILPMTPKEAFEELRNIYNGLEMYNYKKYPDAHKNNELTPLDDLITAVHSVMRKCRDEYVIKHDWENEEN